MVNYYRPHNPPAYCSKARWMFSAASVCLSVCLFVSTITSERLNVGRQVHFTKISPEFEFGVKGQRSRSLGTKKNCWVIPTDNA